MNFSKLPKYFVVMDIAMEFKDNETFQKNWIKKTNGWVPNELTVN